MKVSRNSLKNHHQPLVHGKSMVNHPRFPHGFSSGNGRRPGRSLSPRRPSWWTCSRSSRKTAMRWTWATCAWAPRWRRPSRWWTMGCLGWKWLDSVYSLVNSQFGKKSWKITMLMGKSTIYKIYKWPFSIANCSIIRGYPTSWISEGRIGNLTSVDLGWTGKVGKNTWEILGMLVKQ